MPSLKSFSGIAGRTIPSLFEIRLDNETVVLRGVESEASSQLLRGVVVLCLPGALEVEGVWLRMAGHLKIGRVLLPRDAVGTDLTPCRWNDRVAGAWNPSRWIERSTEIFHHTWPSFVGGGNTGSPAKGILLPPENYEWPFELVIDGSIPETIEGLTSSYLTYKLEATISRGRMGCDLHTHKPVRIVRTLGPASLELAHPMTIECLWSDNVECQMTIPQKGVIFGTEITMQMTITPLLKGLKIGTARCELFEYQEFTLLEAADPRLLRVRVVDSWVFEPNDEDDMLREQCQDRYLLERMLLLPKRLSKCMPDTDACGIKVRHRVRASLTIHNPDGRISEFRASLPITIFISPDMLPDANGRVHAACQGPPRLDTVLHAPPPYEKHLLDQPYMDRRPLRAASMPQSRTSTPIYNCPRSLSSDNLTRPDAIVRLRGIRTADLSERLQGLHPTSQTFSRLFSEGSRRRTLCQNVGSYNIHTRNTAEDITLGTNLENVDYYDLNDLSSVPPYSAAVRAPIPMANYHEALPSYGTAVSVPEDQI